LKWEGIIRFQGPAQWPKTTTCGAFGPVIGPRRAWFLLVRRWQFSPDHTSRRPAALVSYPPSSSISHYNYQHSRARAE
jgi:hypothetical protein